MGEVIQFVPKRERERARLIRRARAIYDSIFPPVDPASENQNEASVSTPPLFLCLQHLQIRIVR